MTGIISYGIYIPQYRLTAREIAGVWGKDGDHVAASLGISEKAVAGEDEDTVTIGYEAAWRAVKSAQIDAEEIGAVFVGSESHPYAVNPSTTIIAEMLGVGRAYFAADLEFACKAATTALVVGASLIDSKKVSYALAIGADCAQAKPHDLLEYSAASAGVALVIGSGERVAVEILDYCSYSSDTPDFWRRDGTSYPSHGGRFTGEPAYFTHVMGAADMIMKKIKIKIADFDYCVFHMPNGKFPRNVARRLGFTTDQLKHSLTVDTIGNPYSASSLLGLANTLDHAMPNQRILFVSYGSGAGSDAFVLQTTNALPDLQKRQHTVSSKMNMKKNISYSEYLKMRGVI